MHLHQTKIRKSAIWLCEASSTFLFIRKHSANIKTQGLPVLSKCVYLFNINARYIIRLLKSPAVHIKKAQLHFFSARLFTVSNLRAQLRPPPRHTALLLARLGSPSVGKGRVPTCLLACPAQPRPAQQRPTPPPAPLRSSHPHGLASYLLLPVEAHLNGKWPQGLS